MTLPPLPKHFQGFASKDDAMAHCRRFGAAEIVEQRSDDGLYWPASFPSQAMAREHITRHSIAGGYAMGLRVNGATRWAVGIDKHAVAPRAAPRTAPQGASKAEGDDTVPVATGTRVAGATFVCKELWATFDASLGKDAFIALCATRGVGASTAGTQFYRLRKG